MATRKQVFDVYRALRRTSRIVFADDSYALKATREKINVEFRKNEHITDAPQIQELISFASDCEKILRASVVQVKKKPDSDHYELKLREGLHLTDNIQYNPDADLPTTFTGKCGDGKEFL